MSTGPARKGVGAVNTVIRKPFFFPDMRRVPPSPYAGTHQVPRINHAKITLPTTRRMFIPLQTRSRASAWVGEQSKPQLRTEAAPAAPRVRIFSGLGRSAR